MRGKLRDKRAVNKRDYFKREVIERRRPVKRNVRVTWHDQEFEDDNFESESDDEANMQPETSPKK